MTETPGTWIRWRVPGDESLAEGQPLRSVRVRSFQVLMFIVIGGLGIIVLRGLVVGSRFPWADLANLLFFAALVRALALRPDRLRLIAWIGLLSLCLNALDGLLRPSLSAVIPSHMLLPLLVLYGALIGDLQMSLAALVFVLAAYAYSAFRSRPLSGPDLMTLTNLSLAAVIAGLAALSVWLQHRKLLSALHRQARDLRRELDARLRLHAVIFHDINNPLTALLGMSAALKAKSPETIHEVEVIDRMAARMLAIIRSARSFERGSGQEHAVIGVAALHEQLREVFSLRLAEKELRFLLEEGGRHQIRTDPQLLCNSILSNIVGNAIKFAPRGTVVEMRARREAGFLRIEFSDRGGGFPADLLEHAARGDGYRSLPGTEGETGTGHGLLIAAHFLRQLGGFLEVRNSRNGGSRVSVLLVENSTDAGPLSLK